MHDMVVWVFNYHPISSLLYGWPDVLMIISIIVGGYIAHTSWQVVALWVYLRRGFQSVCIMTGTRFARSRAAVARTRPLARNDLLGDYVKRPLVIAHNFWFPNRYTLLQTYNNINSATSTKRTVIKHLRIQRFTRTIINLIISSLLCYLYMFRYTHTHYVYVD